MNILDPVILFFLLGVIAQIVKSDLKIPDDFYNTISIYLLLAIGIKGGIELYKTGIGAVIYPAIGTIILGPVIAFLAFSILRFIIKFNKDDSIAIAAHYGSCSAVTFAVITDYLRSVLIPYEEFSTVLLVLFEIPGIAAAILLAKVDAHSKFDIKSLIHDVFFGKSILLLVGGLFIGIFIGYTATKQLNFFFIDLFKGFLAIFMLEMGIVTAKRLGDLKKVGIPLLVFGILFPVIASLLGILTGMICGLSPGGTIILATLAASASYIAAPAAVQIILPNANPTLYLTLALGITFPFNILFGIQLYTFFVQKAYGII
ncbi:MAG: sodium-dependent bicarbonate transport family permease [Ignavibacteria bacterium]